MLEKLSLKHELWVKMAKGICKDAYLADDLVSEMYLKFSDYDKEVNDYYVYFAIKHLYISYLRAEKKYTSIDYDYIETESKQQKELNLPDCITWVEKQILLLRQNASGREIGKKYHIHYTKVHRIEKEAKVKLTEWAKGKSMDLVMS